jgi:hypothetical protein
MSVRKNVRYAVEAGSHIEFLMLYRPRQKVLGLM